MIKSMGSEGKFPWPNLVTNKDLRNKQVTKLLCAADLTLNAADDVPHPSFKENSVRAHIRTT